jgi:cytoskeleton protein RodZ
MTDAVVTVGQRLKAERERRGLSAQKAADDLHLDGWVVDALEAGDYQRVGPSVYAKGHLKRYAELLGLSPSEIMAGYESRTEAPNPPPAPPSNVRMRTDAPTASNPPWLAVAGSVVVVLLVAGVLWWRPWHQRGPAPVHSEPVAANPSAAPADVAGDAAEAAVGSVAGSPTTAASSPAPPPSTVAQPSAPAQPAAADADATAGMGRARLRLSFSADSWVDVHDAAGRRAFAGNGRANSVKTIAGTAPMRVYLGFASGVQLEINNRAVAIGPQFVSGDVARFEAGADGVLRRDTHSVMSPNVQTRNARPTG